MACWYCKHDIGRFHNGDGCRYTLCDCKLDKADASAPPTEQHQREQHQRAAPAGAAPVAVAPGAGSTSGRSTSGRSTSGSSTSGSSTSGRSTSGSSTSGRQHQREEHQREKHQRGAAPAAGAPAAAAPAGAAPAAGAPAAVSTSGSSTSGAAPAGGAPAGGAPAGGAPAAAKRDENISRYGHTKHCRLREAQRRGASKRGVNKCRKGKAFHPTTTKVTKISEVDVNSPPPKATTVSNASPPNLEERGANLRDSKEEQIVEGSKEPSQEEIIEIKDKRTDAESPLSQGSDESYANFWRETTKSWTIFMQNLREMLQRRLNFGWTYFLNPGCQAEEPKTNQYKIFRIFLNVKQP